MADMNLGMEVVGVKDALRLLNKMDKRARLALTKEYKEIVEPILVEARMLTPVRPPLSGMGRPWNPGGRAEVFPWNDQKQDRQMKAFVSGKRPRQSFRGFTSHLATFGVRWNASDAVLVEMAGKGKVPTRRGKMMVQSLTERYGQPGRFFWKAYEKQASQVEKRVKALVDDLMRWYNKEMR